MTHFSNPKTATGVYNLPHDPALLLPLLVYLVTIGSHYVVLD